MGDGSAGKSLGKVMGKSEENLGKLVIGTLKIYGYNVKHYIYIFNEYPYMVYKTMVI